MPHIEFDAPYETYIKNLIQSGLYKTTSEVVKDALRLHMDHDSQAKRIAVIQAGLAAGEADIAAGRVTPYSHEMIDKLTEEAVQDAGE